MAQVTDRRWRKNKQTGKRESTGYNGPSPWLARWRDPDGNQRSQGFGRKVDAEQHIVSVSHRMLAGEYVDPNAGRITVERWCEQWRSVQIHRPSTMAQVESYFRLHVYPTLGERQLRSVLPSEVQAWVTGRSTVLAPGSVELVYRILSVSRGRFEGHLGALERRRVAVVVSVAVGSGSDLAEEPVAGM